MTPNFKSKYHEYIWLYLELGYEERSAISSSQWSRLYVREQEEIISALRDGRLEMQKQAMFEESSVVLEYDKYLRLRQELGFVGNTLTEKEWRGVDASRRTDVLDHLEELLVLERQRFKDKPAQVEAGEVW